MVALAPSSSVRDRECAPTDSFRRWFTASSIDTALLGRLRTIGLVGRVHSVFERAINFESADIGMVTLACKSIGNGPFTLLIDAARIPADIARAGDRVRGDAQSLLVGDGAAVRLAGASLWHGQLPDYPANDSTLAAKLGAMKALLRREGRPGGMLGARAIDGPFAVMASRSLQHEARRLSAALCCGDSQLAGVHARAIVGLGPGLTPSGDDFLLGVLTVLNVPGHPGKQHLPALTQAILGAIGSTNEISFAMLSRALVGAAPERVVGLIEAIVRGAGSDLIVSLRRVLEIGSCSGTDIACGVLMAFTAGARARADHARLERGN